MHTVDASKCGTLNLGYEGEKDRTIVRFFFGDIRKEFPGGIVILQVRRPWDETKHDIAPVIEGDWALWLVSDYELAVRGEGECQLIYSDGHAIAKRKKWKTLVDESIEGADASIPEDWEDIEGRMVTAAGALQRVIESYDEMTARAVQLPDGAAPTAEIDRGGDHPELVIGIPRTVNQLGLSVVDGKLCVTYKKEVRPA